MLVTRLDHELQNGPFIWAPGTQAWRAVTFELAVPYVLVSVRHEEANCRITETSILWRDEDVLELCRDSRANTAQKITRIALLLPPGNAGKANWRIRLVKEIWTKFSRENSASGISYYGANGLRIGATATDENLDLKGTLEYPI
jgi:hypothetical protein